MKNKNNKNLVKNHSHNLIEYFQEEDQFYSFIKEISLKGSLYLEDLNFSNKILEDFMCKVVEMGYTVHLSKVGTLVIDPNFLGGNDK